MEQYNLFIKSIQEIFADEYGKILIFFPVLIFFQGLDIVSGFTKAKILKNGQSHIMAIGFLKKMNFLLGMFGIVILGILIPTVGTKIVSVCFMLLIFMEMVSIRENWKAIKMDTSFIDVIIELLTPNKEGKK